MIFTDRSHAGRELAQRLAVLNVEEPLVLALPRGGVPVAFEAATRLPAPLDTLVVRKIGAPGNPEFGVGAVAPGDVLVLDNASIDDLHLKEDDLDPIIARELEEMDRRMARYQSGEYSKNIAVKTALIIDDGLATGVTAKAAIESVKILFMPERIILAVPVCPKDAADVLRTETEFVCLQEIEDFRAVGEWYEEFPQVADEKVIELLQKANRPSPERR